MSFSSTWKKLGIEQAMNDLYKNPEKNLRVLMDWADKFTGEGLVSQRKAIREAVENKDHPYYTYIRHIIKDIAPKVMETLVTNFFINASLVGWPKQEKLRAELDCNILWAILMASTSACNLHCTGCWAAEYGNRLNMDLDTLDSIISQAKELGIRMFIYSGGEPLMRKKDLITLCEKHSDCVFLSFTNGTLIDEEFADEMLRVGNFVPAISVEGFEEGTDFRRGQGTFARVKAAMELLHRKKLPFGVSCCYTSQNYEMIGSEEYFDWMVEMGAKFCWIFTYMPVGSGAPTDLMATAEQREYMYRQVRAFRRTKTLFTMDFWNDGEFVGGCIAAGRNYLHINANGDIEPCAFIHYSDSNIHDKTLLQAFQSPLFMAYRAGQPFSDNLLRPCPLLDNPGALAGMVEHSGAHSTDLQSPEDVHDLSEKCREKAERWKPAADRLWACGHDCPGCEVK